MAQLKALIFDLGKVIVPFDFRRGYVAMAPFCSYPAEEIPRRIGSTDLVQRYETGQVKSDDFFRELSAQLELEVSFERFAELWSAIFLPETLIPESLLAGLRGRYRLVLLSNTNELHFRMIRERYALLRHMHEFVLSFEVGVAKPSPQIYREAITRAGCRPEECFFTDDIPAYVDGARREGIDAVQFHSYSQLVEDLRARGVEV